jgi:hypothetical protein
MSDAEKNHTSSPDGNNEPPVWPPSEDAERSDISTSQDSVEFTQSGCFVEDDGGQIWVANTTAPPIPQYQGYPVQFYPQVNAYPPVQFFPPVQFYQPVEDYPVPVVCEFQIGIPKGKSTKKVNVTYMSLTEYIVQAYKLDKEQAVEFTRQWYNKLNTAMTKNREFCEFFGGPSRRILNIKRLLNGDLKVYKKSFDSGVRPDVMSVYYSRKGKRVPQEKDIWVLFNEYRGLLYKSRSLHVTTDSIGMTGFADSKGSNHVCTLKLFTQILCSGNFELKEESDKLFQRKAGFRIDDGPPMLVRWTGSF